MASIIKEGRRVFLLHCASLPLIGCSIRPLPALKTFATLQPNPLNIRQAKVGQSWKYLKINQFNSEPVELIDEQISSVENGQITLTRQGQKSQNLGNEIQFPLGQILTDSDWDYNQTYHPVIPIYLDLNQINSVATIQTSYQVGNSSYRLPMAATIRQLGWESITIPSGTFTAMRIEKLIRFQHNDSTRLDSIRFDRYWYSPEIGRWVVRETDGRYFYVSGRRRTDLREDFWRYELQSWTK